MTDLANTSPPLAGHDRHGSAARVLRVVMMGLAVMVASSPGSIAAAEDEGGPHEENRFEGPNHLSVFTGLSFEEGFRGAPTIGLDYEYRFTFSFGVGALLDYAARDFRELAVGIPFVYHPGEEPAVYLAPGFDRGLGETELRLLLRLGFLYDFDLSHGTIAPNVNLDFVEGGDWILVVGVLTGRRF